MKFLTQVWRAICDFFQEIGRARAKRVEGLWY